MPHFCGRTHSAHDRRAYLEPERPVVTAPAPAPAKGALPRHEEVAKLAYSYWEARGCQGGSAMEDWLRAERELQKR